MAGRVPMDRPAPPTPPLPHVVHVTAEYWPLAQAGGLAEAVAGLAKAQRAAGVPVSVVLPLYRAARNGAGSLEAVGAPVDVRRGGVAATAALYRGPTDPAGPALYFVEVGSCFDRPGIYGEGGADYGDNAERFLLFCLAVLRFLPRIGGRRPPVLHVHDWHAALVPVLLRERDTDPRRPMPTTVLTVHNAAFQGHFPWAVGEALGLVDPPSAQRLEWYGGINFLKGGIVAADAVTTVSPNHARELLTPEGGFGFHDLFAALGDRFVGIVNGVDTARWDPRTDPEIAARYGAGDLAGKGACKRALQEEYHLPADPETPLAVMTSRLVEQKGVDLILGEAFRSDAFGQLIVLGRGEERYESALRGLAAEHASRVAVPLAFSDAQEHRLLAGADVLLMPSRFEPCGLAQMRAQRYGTVPVAHRAGGLADTVEHEVTGFLFEPFLGDALVDAVARSRTALRDRAAWERMMLSGMACDFSWAASVGQYLDLYAAAIARRGVGRDAADAAARRSRGWTLAARRALRSR